MAAITITGLNGIPEVSEGMDLAQLIIDAAHTQGVAIEEGDVLVVTSKVVSKAEGRVVKLRDMKPSTLAKAASKLLSKQPEAVEAILSEAKRVVRMAKGILLTETRHGFVCANSGVDESNTPTGSLTLLPLDPDKSARGIKERIKDRLGVNVGVIISDTFGRPWREAQVDVAVGLAGMKPIRDYTGLKDNFGYEMRVSAAAVADEVASAAELVMGKVDRSPVAVVKGFKFAPASATARELVRRPSRDLFR